MLFNSGTFLYFFLAVYLAYRVLPHRGQNLLLLAASYVFYGFWDVRFLSLILISSLVDFTAGLRIDSARRAGDPQAAKRWLWLSIAVNLGILGTFKYFGFFADSLRAILSAVGFEITPFTLSLVLPVGISFYTFQTLSYSIDVYRGHARATSDLLDFCLFVAFFPQLMAGPIERHRKLFPQIQRPRSVTPEHLARGGWLIFWGLFKKVFIGDGLEPYTAWGLGDGGVETSVDTWLMNFAFAMRYYCDFSGYSDMAIGLAALLGFRLSRNFNLPYFSSSPRELFGRWHITLAAWMRDYVYATFRRRWSSPAGRHGALIAAMLCMGLWHGASWTFVLWGAAWGMLLVGHQLLHPHLVRLERAAPAAGPWIATGGVFFTLGSWLVLCCFFVAPTLPRALELLGLLFSPLATSPFSPKDFWTVTFYCAPLIVMQVAQKWTGRMDIVLRLPLPARVLIYFTLACLLLGAGAEGDREFLYFQF
ncbi:MAG: MBOAT family O-acyltransferase [Acidobacteriota bacterium]